jgi:GR25 family glycosyltransferase involved in LPS biosynthesis
MVNVNFVKSSQIEYSPSTKLPESSGGERWRIKVGSAGNEIKIAAVTYFIALYELFDALLSFFGCERKWVKMSVVDDQTQEKSEILINVNSLYKRTLMSREEILTKSPDQLSELLSKAEQMIPKYKKLNDHFKHVTLINLDSRPDRIESLSTHLNTIGESDFQYTRQSAVLGKELPATEINRMMRGEYAASVGKDDRPGRMGCYMSHLQAVRDAREKGYPNVLILEDDVRFMPESFGGNAAHKAFSELPEDWGILFWGHYDADRGKAESFSDHLTIPGCPYDLHGWMINASAYDALIELLEKELEKDNGQVRPIDVVIGEDIKKKMKVFATKENMIIQDEGMSSIQNQKVGGNYYQEVLRLQGKMSEPLVKGLTADGMPVVEPLLAGTLYQMMYHVDQIFAQHGVTYWIEGGTCLGAERHKGLIPWDDHLSICLAPGMEEKFKSEGLRNALAAIGLEVENHWLGLKIFAKESHPVGMEHQRDGSTFKTPAMDLFITKCEVKEGETVYSYGTERAAALWNTHYKVSEVFGSKGKIRRTQFGPIKVNGLWNGAEFCKRNYGANCFQEGHLQYDHLNEVPLARKPVKLTDFRPPAYEQWEELPTVDFDKTKEENVKVQKPTKPRLPSIVRPDFFEPAFGA